MATPGWVLGVDEAGYGPNLGPLVVAATLWQVDLDAWGDDGRTCLAGVVTDTHPPRRRDRSAGRAARTRTSDVQASLDDVTALPWLVCDSKRAYTPATGREPLTRSVTLAAHLLQDDPPDTDGPAIRLDRATLAPHPAAWPESHAPAADPWDGTPRGEIDPSDLSGATRTPEAKATVLSSEGKHLRERLAAAGVRLAAMQARIVTPFRFNAMLEQGFGKADILLATGLGLIEEILGRLPREGDDPRNTPHDAEVAPVRIDCDRIGGRKFYAAPLAEALGVPTVSVVSETPIESRYRARHAERDLTITFTVGGERRVAVALASMLAKHLREEAMREFNAFWQAQLRQAQVAEAFPDRPPTGGPLRPPLRPTAGYPGDAMRFLTDLGDLPERLGIERHRLWRVR